MSDYAKGECHHGKAHYECSLCFISDDEFKAKFMTDDTQKPVVDSCNCKMCAYDGNGNCIVCGKLFVKRKSVVREWIIFSETDECGVDGPSTSGNKVKVIEKSAYDTAIADHKEATKLYEIMCTEYGKMKQERDRLQKALNETANELAKPDSQLRAEADGLRREVKRFALLLDEQKAISLKERETVEQLRRELANAQDKTRDYYEKNCELVERSAVAAKLYLSLREALAKYERGE